MICSRTVCDHNHFHQISANCFPKLFSFDVCVMYRMLFSLVHCKPLMRRFNRKHQNIYDYLCVSFEQINSIINYCINEIMNFPKQFCHNHPCDERFSGFVFVGFSGIFKGINAGLSPFERKAFVWK
jgi:hypothetical protein